MLTGSWSLSSELRVPAISRLQKIHNVSLVFSELARRCVTPEWKGDWLICILIEAGLIRPQKVSSRWYTVIPDPRSRSRALESYKYKCRIALDVI